METTFVLSKLPNCHLITRKSTGFFYLIEIIVHRITKSQNWFGSTMTKTISKIQDSCYSMYMVSGYRLQGLMWNQFYSIGLVEDLMAVKT